MIGVSSVMAALRLSGEMTTEVHSPKGAIGHSRVTFPVTTSQYFAVPSLNLARIVLPLSLNVRTRETPGTTLRVSNVAASQTLFVAAAEILFVRSSQRPARSLLSGDQINGDHCARPERAG